MPLIDSHQRLGPSQISIALPALSPDHAAGKALYLVGHPNRGRNTRAFLVVNTKSLAPLPVIHSLPGNVLGLQLNDVYAKRFADERVLDTEHSASPTLILASEDEPAEIMLAVLGGGAPAEDAIAVAEGDTCCLNSRSKFKEVPPNTSSASFFVTPADYGKELTGILAQMRVQVDPKADACYFFASLDAVSNPALGNIPANLVAPITNLLTILKQNRLFTRRNLCTDCSTNCPPWQGPQPAPGSTLSNAAITLSQLMLDLMKKHLGDPATAAGLAAIEQAFERFSNGELRVRLKKSKVWTTQPSSAFYFLFAEFAFLACEAGVSAAIWEKLANVFVRTQPVYCNAYKPAAPPAGPYHFGDYGACNYCTNKPFKASKFDELRSEYNGLSLDDLRRRAACNARTYFLVP